MARGVVVIWPRAADGQALVELTVAAGVAVADCVAAGGSSARWALCGPSARRSGKRGRRRLATVGGHDRADAVHVGDARARA